MKESREKNSRFYLHKKILAKPFYRKLTIAAEQGNWTKPHWLVDFIVHISALVILHVKGLLTL